MKAPAEYFNWQWNRTYLAIKELQEKASEIKTINNQGPDANGNINVTIDLSKSASQVDFDAHVDSIVYSSEVHGLRIVEGVLEYWNGEEWLVAQIGEGFSGVPVIPINELHAVAGDGKVTLSWYDPPNTQAAGVELSRWAGTKIMRKTNGYPENENDGVLVVSSTVRNQYYETPFVDTNVQNGTTYYYAAFPYTENDVYTNHSQQRAKAKPLAGIMDPDPIDNPDVPNSPYIPYYGFTISDSSAFMGSSYIWNDQWTGELKGKTSIDFSKVFPFNRMRPVLFKDGAVVAELNKENFAQDKNGNAVDIESGEAGDVMIEIPKIYFKLEDKGTKLEYKYSEYQVDETWKPIAHTKGSEVKDFLYISAYMGSNVNGKLRSLSGKQVETRKSVSELRALAQANGAGYELINYYQYAALIMLYMFFTRNPSPNITTDGLGYDENYTGRITGTTDAEGMTADMQTAGQLEYYPRIKYFGIEDLYRGYNTWLDGILTDGSCNYLLATTGYNDTGLGYKSYQSGLTIAGADPSGNNYTGSFDVLTPFLPVAEDVNSQTRGKFSNVTYVRAHKPFITGTGNPSDTHFDQVFTDYVERDTGIVSYDASRIVYL
ncbi:hypothetical protein AAHH17_16390 [Lysinibacillus capsici]|uniref:hypothetical protein n=1 Tax=Lysinibacillus capsici TaxID=2115968 RepID=UPI0032E4DD08